ncbi:MAG: 1-acyl-sn-glycerol-3-phosphate acyltransferase [Paludibacteraceae bacterium]|nr:1-acyl-sn-glycerol-3-phosphate acyltransferase [Paludibacteraceae bacterium]
MDRYTLGKFCKFLLHLHYDIRVTGEELLRDKATHLVLPNHTAYVDPLLLFSQVWWLPIRPLVDERFMRHWFFGHILSKADAIEVPDLEKSVMSREQGAMVAGQLSRIAIDSLAEGKQLCFYPSGHVKTVDKEIIGNRRLAYEVCRELPENVKVVLCRMRGLEGSRWSKLRPKNRKWRRTVTMLFEDHTEDVRQWAQTLSRREFNERLEEWYNQQPEAYIYLSR